jgi:LEA14-like dessication related protein
MNKTKASPRLLALSIRFGLFLVITFLLIGAFYTQVLDKPAIRQVKSFEVVNVDSNNISTKITLELYKQGWFNVTMQDCAIKISYKNHLITSFKMKERIRLSKGINTLTIYPTFNADSLLTFVPEMLKKDSVLLEITFQCKASIFRLPIKLKELQFIETKKFTNQIIAGILKDSGVKMLNIEAVDFSITKTLLNMSVQIKNTLPFPFEIKEFKGVICTDSTGKTVVGSFQTNPNQLLKENDLDTLQSEISINNIAAGLSSLNRIFSGKWAYVVSGVITFKALNHELSLTALQPILIDPRTRKIELIKAD